MLGFLSKKIDRYIAVSEYVKQEYIKHGYQAHRIDVVPNFIDINGYAKRRRETHEGVNIIYVGRMSKEKGVQILMRAFERVCKSNKNARLFLIGAGPSLDDYRALAREIGIETKVLFPGHLSYEMLDYYYSIADIFVHPALFNEPFNLTLLEAMAHEIPILVSDVGSLSSIVKEAGIVFEMGNVDDLEDKLSFLLANSDRISALSKKCSTVLAEYDDSKVLRTLIASYESIMND